MKHQRTNRSHRQSLSLDPRHRRAIARLRPGKRALDICRHLGVATIADFLATARADFLAAPGCSPRVLRDLEQRVTTYLARAGRPLVKVQQHGWHQPLSELGLEAAQLHACGAAGLTTVADFLAMPRANLVGPDSLGPVGWQKVLQAVRAAMPPKLVDLTLLPQRWLRLPLVRLGLRPELTNLLAQRGCRELADVLETPALLNDSEVGPEGQAALREALDRLAVRGLDLPAARAAGKRTFAEVWSDLLTLLPPSAQDLVRLRLGSSESRLRIRDLAARRGQTESEVRAALAAARRTLRQGAGATLDLVREEGRGALQAGDGIVCGDSLAPDSILAGASHAGLNPLLPLRLLSFCWPDEFHVLGTVLTRTPTAKIQAAQRVLRRAIKDLPCPLTTLLEHLRARDLEIDHGVLLQLLREQLGLGVRFQPAKGEIVERRPDLVASRAYAILREMTGPVSLEDLMFHYRDRHRRCHKGKLLDHMRGDPRLLEVGPERWSLRERHLTELDALAPRIRRLSERIRTARRRANVFEMAEQEGMTEREAWLVRSSLRRDLELRDLGRGDFFPREQKLSGVLQDLVQAVRRAASELPIAHFLENQDPARRTLIDRLLSNNRLFVEPTSNRVDLLTNYPFNGERLASLERIVGDFLAECGGFATVRDVRARVMETELGGGFLSEHLLADVLRRLGKVEVLPGGVIAQRALELGHWIRRKAREVLRQAGILMTGPEIVSEAPELAPFTECLEELLATDPMVQSGEGLHYRVL